MTQLYPDDCDADVYLKKNIFSQEGSSCFYERYKCYRMLLRNSAVKNEKFLFTHKASASKNLIWDLGDLETSLSGSLF